MDRIGGGEIAHAGTFGANGSSMAAAKAVLEILKSSPVLDDMRKRGEVLKSGMDKVLTDAGIPHQMTGHPNMQGFLITETPANEVRDLANHDDNFYNAIMAHLYENGVWAEMDAREPWFISESHTDELIRETLNKFEDAVIAAKN
jgi:glutamate-1-semialdehyde 2,1-aminomutase